MEVVILHDATAIGGVAADAIKSLLSRKPAAVLGLATGSSPLAIYDELAARCGAGRLSFRQARGFTLDEYVGLPADHPERYRTVIDKVFVSQVDFAPGAVQGPDGLADGHPGRVRGVRERRSAKRAVRSADSRDRYRRAYRLQRAGVLARLTHPDQDADPADPDRQRAVLRRRPRRGTHPLPDPGSGHHHGGPARDPGGHRPGKAEAVHHLVEGPVSALWPATILQLHPHATVLLDDAAAAAGSSLPTTTARRTVPSRPGRASEAALLIAADTVLTGRELLRPGWIERLGGTIEAVGSGFRPVRRRTASARRRSCPDSSTPMCTAGAARTFPSALPSETATAVALHRRHGTTTLVASLVTAGPAELMRQVAELADDVHTGLIAGIHLEGPWISTNGAAPTNRPSCAIPTPMNSTAFLRWAVGRIRMVTLAPERDGALAAIRQIADAGAVAAVGSYRGDLRTDPRRDRGGRDSGHPPVQRDAPDPSSRTRPDHRAAGRPEGHRGTDRRRRTRRSLPCTAMSRAARGRTGCR